MAVAGAKPSVSVDIVKYQGRTKLLELALSVADAKKLNNADTLKKIEQGKELRIWLKALEFSSFLSYEDKFKIVYSAIDIGDINDFPTAPTLGTQTRPNILIGSGGDTVINNYGESATSFSNSDIDTPFEVVDSFSYTISNGVRWEYSIVNLAGTAMRKGSIIAGWLPNGSQIECGSEITTNDIGDTSDVTFSVDIVAGEVRLLANVVTNNWRITGKRYLD